jgi:hypothetical protein
MHHYSLQTSRSVMAQSAEVQRTLQLWVPEEATKYPFLFKGILALSSLHLAHLRPSEKSKWVPIAYSHQITALAAFRPILTKITEENCHAAFTLSMLLSVTSITLATHSSALRPEQKDLIPIGDIFESFMMVRGILQVLRVCLKWIAAGPTKVFLCTYYRVHYPRTPLPVSTAEQFTKLRAMIRERCPEAAVQDALNESLMSLEAIYEEAMYDLSRGTKVNLYGAIWKWPTQVQKCYVSLLKELHPGALVLFAYFAVLSKLVETEWYLSGWSEWAIQAISSVVDSDWKQWLRWPEEQLRQKFLSTELCDGVQE